MRSSIDYSIAFLALLLALFATASADAQIRAITLNLIPEQSVIMLDGSLKIGGIPEPDSSTEVAFAPQKAGGDPGPDSRFAKNFGTVEAVVDFDNDILQITGGFTQPVNSGDYCPGPFPTEGANVAEGPDGDDVNQCPTEAPGALALKIAGDINSTVRDSFSTLRGQSSIGTLGEIETLNWHLYTIVSRSDFDGTTVLDTTTGILDVDQRWNAANEAGGTSLDLGEVEADKVNFSNIDRVSLINAAHNENDPRSDDFTPAIGTVNEATAFKGTFNISGENATLTVPIWVPAVLADNLTLENPAEDFIRIILKGLGTGAPGEFTATGTFGDTLTPGDANNDGMIDGLDVNIISKHWTKGEGNDSSHTPDLREVLVREHPKYANFYEGDFDLNSRITQDDLDVIIAGFGTTVGAGAGRQSQSVPEPGSLLLAALAALALGTVRRPRNH